MKNIHFIINPASGKGKGINAISSIEDMMKEAKVAYKIKVSEHKETLTHLAQSSVIEGATDIIAVGGDGTLREVMAGMYHSDCRLGLIPVGTGNDFSKYIGEPKDIRMAIKTILNQNVELIDIGIVNGIPFINVMSWGIDSQIIKQVTYYKKWMPGSLAYVLSSVRAILSSTSICVEVELNGKKEELQIILIAVGNGTHFGGGMAITPSAKVDDGYLDVCIIKKMSVFKLLKYFPLLIKGNHTQLNEVIYEKVKGIKVSTKCNNMVNMDGDLVINGPIDVSILEKKVKFIV